MRQVHQLVVAAVVAAALTVAGVPAAATAEVPVGPTVLIGSAPEATSAGSTATFAFSADVEATFACGLDGAELAPCSSPAEYAALADGPHLFRVVATDGQGVAGAPAEVSWVVDTTAPETALVAAPPSRRPRALHLLRRTHARSSNARSTASRSPPATAVRRRSARSATARTPSRFARQTPPATSTTLPLRGSGRSTARS